MSDLAALLSNYPLLATIVALAALVLAALFANFVVKVLLLKLVNRFIGQTAYGRDEELRQHDVIKRLANIMPAFVIASGIVFVPGLPPILLSVVRNVANAFILLTIALAIGEAMNILDKVYNRRPIARRRPIKGYVQVGKIAVYIIAAVLILATLMDQSPVILLSGLGAMAAVLILVFQDTLLGLVAGVQISSTDMVRVGDWIEAPGQHADGEVIEIALHTVKVQNWDKTITTVPIRKLVTEPFRNWRPMQESGGRRIKRALLLDQSTIGFLNEQELRRLARFYNLENYLTEKQLELATFNKSLGDKAGVPANTRRATNLGTFRAYIQNYLKGHPGVHQRMTLMVRQMPPSPQGLPLEIYCFTNTVAWVEYEGIQADIFDHLYAILPEFGLRAFQAPAGADFRSRSDSGAFDAADEVKFA
ncbi:mechanosensitive ion channel family protein [Devosia naphthalenivorans]|uniref:mechanosensitive ion channel family protein n=1 Tax=Devosia naphthalenivorans TaxID=2082392 RepID=UPI001FEC77BA|nr:mechanosensitive ion channel domain-containing protein [Devosia naphthalenivorans]